MLPCISCACSGKPSNSALLRDLSENINKTMRKLPRKGTTSPIEFTPSDTTIFRSIAMSPSSRWSLQVSAFKCFTPCPNDAAIHKW